MPVGELAEVVVEDPDVSVGQPPRLPGADDQGAHAPDLTGVGVTGVSVVVCTRNRPQLLAQALVAVRAAMRPEDELVVVDSASTDAQVAVVATDAGARVLRTDRPGLGHARNAGWRAASRAVVAFTDDDCLPAPGWTGPLEAAFADARVGAAFGQVRGEGSGEPVSTLESDVARLVGPDDPPSMIGHGANMAWRVQTLEAIGGFDDLLGAGGRFPSAEDTDATWRMFRLGWWAAFTPDSLVTHQLWRGRRDYLRTMWGYGLGSGAAAAKARRAGDPTHWLRREIWNEGVRASLRDLRHRYEFGAVGSMLRAGGAVVGAARSRRLAVGPDGRFDS